MTEVPSCAASHTPTCPCVPLARTDLGVVICLLLSDPAQLLARGVFASTQGKTAPGSHFHPGLILGCGQASLSKKDTSDGCNNPTAAKSAVSRAGHACQVVALRMCHLWGGWLLSGSSSLLPQLPSSPCPPFPTGYCPKPSGCKLELAP